MHRLLYTVEALCELCGVLITARTGLCGYGDNTDTDDIIENVLLEDDDVHHLEGAGFICQSCITDDEEEEEQDTDYYENYFQF